MKEALRKLLQAPQEASANAIHDIIATCVRGTGTIFDAIEDIVRGSKRNNFPRLVISFLGVVLEEEYPTEPDMLSRFDRILEDILIDKAELSKEGNAAALFAEVAEEVTTLILNNTTSARAVAEPKEVELDAKKLLEGWMSPRAENLVEILPFG